MFFLVTCMFFFIFFFFFSSRRRHTRWNCDWEFRRVLFRSAEVPVVIFDIQRIGPSTGLPTRTSQADLGFVYTLSHGDTKHLVLLPGTVEECFEFAQQAFDLADRDRKSVV